MRDDTDPAAEEAPAHTRQAAKSMREIYIALRGEGFTEQQALALLGQMLAVSIAGQQWPRPGPGPV